MNWPIPADNVDQGARAPMLKLLNWGNTFCGDSIESAGKHPAEGYRIHVCFAGSSGIQCLGIDQRGSGAGVNCGFCIGFGP